MGTLCKMSVWLVMQVQESPWPQPSFDRLQTKVPLAAEVFIPRKCSSVCSTRDRALVQTEGQRTGYQPFSISRDKYPMAAAQKTARPGEEALVPGLWSMMDLSPTEVARGRWLCCGAGPKPPAGTSQTLGCFLPFISPSCLLRPGPNPSSGASASSHQLWLDSAELWQAHLERHFGVCIPPPCPSLRCASLKRDWMSFCFPPLEAISGKLIYWEISAGLSLKIWGGVKNCF